LSESTQEVSNYIVVIHGRGVLQTCLTKGTLEDVCERAEACLLSGFEVHVYSLKLNTSGRPSYLPESISPLQQEFHMWDAADEFSDLVNSIVMTCDSHTVGMSKRYIQQCIEQLNDELAKLTPSEGSEHIANEPTFFVEESAPSAPEEGTTTGS